MICSCSQRAARLTLVFAVIYCAAKTVPAEAYQRCHSTCHRVEHNLTVTLPESSYIKQTYPIVVGSNQYSFVAVDKERSDPLIAWGPPDAGGKIPAEIQDKLAHVVEVTSTAKAFAALTEGRTVEPWGHKKYGGVLPRKLWFCRDKKKRDAMCQYECEEGEDGMCTRPCTRDECALIKGAAWMTRLHDVEEVFATARAFTVLNSSGSIPGAWGDTEYGGYLRGVVHQVSSVASSCSAFVAWGGGVIRAAWGDPEGGGQLPSGMDPTAKVQEVFSNDYAFVALMEDGTIGPAWGSESSGGLILPELREQLIGVRIRDIYANAFAFVAISEQDILAGAWGAPLSGGDIPEGLQDALINVKDILATEQAFVATSKNNEVIGSWGSLSFGGVIPDELMSCKTVTQVEQAPLTMISMSAIPSVPEVETVYHTKENGDKMTALECSELEGIPKPTWHNVLVNVKQVISTSFAFAVLTNSGEVYAWGDPSHGGKVPAHVEEASNVGSIYATCSAFVALAKGDETFVGAWGDMAKTGDIPTSLQPIIAAWS